MALCRESQESQPVIREEPPPSLLECAGEILQAPPSPLGGAEKVSSFPLTGLVLALFGEGDVS